MNLEELQAAHSTERQRDSLQELRDSFYADAREYIQELRDRREAIAADAADPFSSPEVARLTDDIETAEHALEALYDRRIGKVVKMASMAAADMQVEREGLTVEERDLFETLVEAIERNRSEVLDDLLAGGGGPAGFRSPPASAAAEGQSSPDPEESQDPAEEPPDSHDAGDDVDRRTVRITDDVGAILGVDEREYDLSEDDIVTLPAANADPLVERDAAVFLD